MRLPFSSTFGWHGTKPAQSKNSGSTESVVQILCGDEGHRARCNALQAITPGSSIANASGPALDKKAMKINTLTFWGHGDASKFCGLTATDFTAKVLEWVKWNPSIKTVEIITCNARHGTLDSEKKPDGSFATSWVQSYTDQVRAPLKKAGLTIKALPLGMGSLGANRWSILKWSATTKTWLYVTGNGAKDTDEMWPGVHAVEDSENFKVTKNYVTAGSIIKPKLNIRKFTLDFGNAGDLRGRLVVLA
ncbi:hypothetical protein MKK68_15855 [Methylobacterium sp. E-016]|uniref:hypothetical protein n=1 Tax=Methylobacterium sp. E-016 TaxID=2836556 RepID=UPI001FBAFA66|nr:hypothetical protein [Methylobacterium sp. E-016]MCJ2077106.1 hypothetical protein [Methylobacterium sp. E-016]